MALVTHFLLASEEKARRIVRASPCRSELVIHASSGRHGRHGRLLFRFLGNHGLSRHEQSGNRGCILQGGADDLGRVDDALGHQVTVLAFLGIIAIGVRVILADLADDDRSILASIDGDLASRRTERFPDDVDASLLIVVLGSQFAERLDGPQ